MHLATHAMGTRFEFFLPGEDSPSLRAAGEEALSEIQRWHARLSRFQPDSLVAAINREGRGRVDAETFEFLEVCEHVHIQSGGAFDVTLGRAMENLGFHPPPPGERGSGGGLGEASDAQPLPARELLLHPPTLTVHLAPASALDLGAVAKGFALDRAAAALLDAGVTSALLHGGTSSIVALGSPPDDPGGWSIAVRCDGEPLRLHLRDRSVGVSAPRGRASEAGTHILDPHTGRPAASPLDTAAVVGPVGSAARCDAWSTALIVLAGGGRDANLPPDLACFTHTAARGWSQSVSSHSEPA